MSWGEIFKTILGALWWRMTKPRQVQTLRGSLIHDVAAVVLAATDGEYDETERRTVIECLELCDDPDELKDMALSLIASDGFDVGQDEIDAVERIVTERTVLRNMVKQIEQEEKR